MLNERIKKIRKLYRKNQEDFGLRLGISKSAVSSMESARYNITDSLIKLICKEFDINEEWLINGVGEMKKVNLPYSENEDNPFNDLIKALMKSYQQLDTASREIINNAISEQFDITKKEQSRL